VKSELHVPGAPAAIGPYSHAQVVRLHGGQRMVFTSGQVGLVPETGELVGPGVPEQTRQALKNLATVLAGAGLSLADVVKTTVFLVDMADFSAMNEVYAKAFEGHKPARSTVAVAGLPRAARVEVEAVAMSREL
jgi:2-iminobutanoate/2-iminopropanoate deaminase